VSRWHPDATLARLDDAARQWVARAAGRGYRVVHVRGLVSGGYSALHAVIVESPKGVRRALVLKRLYRQMFHDFASLAVRWERKSLLASEKVELETPRLVAADPEGEEAGAPAVLMTKVRGRVKMNVGPDEVVAMADALRLVHAVDGESVDLLPWRLWRIRPDFEPPPWTKDQRLWTELRDLVGAGRPDAVPGTSLVHGDFHPGNVVWHRGRLSGIVDWQTSNTGDPEVDLAHCRTNLVFLAGSESARQLLRRYRGDSDYPDLQRWHDAADAAAFLPDPADSWDWSGMGRRDLTRPLLRRRLEQWVRRILR
jgi:hypothetical protein